VVANTVCQVKLNFYLSVWWYSYCVFS